MYMGQIIGGAYFGENSYQPFLYHGGTAQFFEDSTHLSDINDNGQIVGSGNTTGTTRAFLWQNGVFTDLGTLGGESSVAFAINNQAQVVGWAETANGRRCAFSWKDGVMTRIGALSYSIYDEKSYGSYAHAINSKGNVVGTSAWLIRDTYTVTRPWRWKRKC